MNHDLKTKIKGDVGTLRVDGKGHCSRVIEGKATNFR